MLDPEIYDHLSLAAAKVSKPLKATIEQVGPLHIAAPTHGSVAERLFVEVVNQQRMMLSLFESTIPPKPCSHPILKDVMRSCIATSDRTHRSATDRPRLSLSRAYGLPMPLAMQKAFIRPGSKISVRSICSIPYG